MNSDRQGLDEQAISILRELTGSSDVGLVVIDDEERSITWASPAAEQLIGYPLPAGRPFNVSLRRPSTVRGADDLALSLVPSPGRLADRPVHLVVLQDVTAYRERIKSLSHAAATDPLTNLLHKRGLRDVIDADRARLSNGAVLFIDLNGFKSVNDTHGHEVGDAVLVAVSLRLANAARSSDLVARWGGDEFVVVTDSYAAAQRLSQRITDSLATPIAVDKLRIDAKAAIGIAYADEVRDTDAEPSLVPEPVDLDDLVRLADRNMYLRKAEEKRDSAVKRHLHTVDLRDPAVDLTTIGRAPRSG